MSENTGHEGPYTGSSRLEDQAASAALHATKDSPRKKSHPLLDEDGKLSSASAATSLKHARAQDLPSFPSQGGVSMSSAGAAASLADSNKKSFEHWRPGSIPAANKAAMLAKDYEMDPLWQPEMSKAGSKAALLAARDPKSVEIWKATESEHGRSAAGQAVGKKPPGAITERNSPAEDQKKALMAATGAMSNRARAGSAPTKPQPENQGQSAHAGWALKAATSSHKAQPGSKSGEFTVGDPGFEAARIQNAAKNNVSRSMYGSNPPVAIEVEEQNRQAMLKASAIAMAQKMYAIQQTHIDEAKGTRRSDSHYGATAARNRATSDASDASGSEVKAPHRYENLEEAARKLAQERLAKIHDEHAEYRQYYGASSSQPKSRFSVRHRRRASSTSDDDEEQSRKIRSQMSLFQSKLAEVDGKKRQSDRDSLMAAAQRNVQARMTALDEKVFQDTGKSSPQQKELWERQAREKAQRDSDERMINTGKVHIGGGKYMDQSEIDAIAKARLQPTLDDIADKAEKQRARDEELRLEAERKKKEAADEKAKAAGIKADTKAANEREKQEERARKTEERRIQKEEAAAAKNKRAAEAAAEKERLRAEKGESKQGRFSGLMGRGTAAGAPTGGATAAAATDAPPITEEAQPRTLAEDHAELAEPAEPVKQRIADDSDEESSDDDRVIPPQQNTVLEEPSSTTAVTRETNANVESEVAGKSSSEAERRVSIENAVATPMGEIVTSPTTKDESKPKSKSWFSRFRSGSKAQPEDAKKVDSTGTSATVITAPSTQPTTGTTATTATDDVESVGIAGTATVTAHDLTTQSRSSSDDELPRSDSMRDVALAGRAADKEDDDLYGGSKSDDEIGPVTTAEEVQSTTVIKKSPSVSSLSSNEPAQASTIRPATAGSVDSEPETRGRQGFRQRLLSKVKKEKRTKTEPSTTEQKTVTTDGEDDFEEARDHFTEETLAPPPKLSAATASPHESQERSKFKEEL